MKKQKISKDDMIFVGCLWTIAIVFAIFCIGLFYKFVSWAFFT